MPDTPAADGSGHGRWDHWGPLAERYRRPGPRRILALDGGGLRGVITLSVLQELEHQLGRQGGTADDFRLCDYFDLIGGTGSGAAIAAGLALGLSVAELRHLQGQLAPAFSSPTVAPSADPRLSGLLQDVYGAETTLAPDRLRCLLVVVMRNATTDSAWPLSSNPSARYDDATRPDSHLRIPLWRLVRASVTQQPESVSFDDAPDRASVFVDGGTTPYNNPAFLLFRMVTEAAYGLGWQTGEDHLLIVSVGAGHAPRRPPRGTDAASRLIEPAARALAALIDEVSTDQDVSCRVVGRCTYGGIIDRETGGPVDLEGGELFTYVRYNAELTPDGLLQLGLRSLDIRDVVETDSPDSIYDLEEVGTALAQRVDLRHLGAFAETPVHWEGR